MTMDVVLRSLNNIDNLNGFSLGSPLYQPLKSFLQKQAKSFHQSNIAKTYVVTNGSDSSKVLAYVTLVSSEITLVGNDTNLIDDCESAHHYEALPALKIARLAVDRRYQDIRIGSLLLDFSISIAQQEIMPHIGCRFVIVDSKQGAINYYQSKGFTLLDTPANRESDHPVLFIDRHKL